MTSSQSATSPRHIICVCNGDHHDGWLTLLYDNPPTLLLPLCSSQPAATTRALPAWQLLVPFSDMAVGNHGFSTLAILPVCFVLLAFDPAATAVFAMQVSELAAKPFVQRALRNPALPSSVLSFFYGVDVDSDEGRRQLRSGTSVREMESLWYGGGPKYDQLCQPFAPVVRDAGQRKLVGCQWEDVNGAVAQLILCDQLSRNIFRGSSEAFAYDPTALEHARSLTSLVLDRDTSNDNDQETKLCGELYPPFLSNVVTALMHSEDPSDHANAVDLLEYAKSNTAESLWDWWDNQTEFELQHKVIIDQFGRYPHRNKAHGRESTPEETKWLDDVENLPPWARSQLPGDVAEK
jgi:uncharacterized protein (DUF924 family)